MHKTFFIFSKSIFQPASRKYVSNVLFRFRNISERYFKPKHRISTIFKKVGNPLFAAYLLTSSKITSFSSQIVKYGQTIIRSLYSGLSRCFHTPIMIPFHVQIQNSNSRKKKFEISFLMRLLKGCFQQNDTNFFLRIKIFSDIKNHVDLKSRDVL